MPKLKLGPITEDKPVKITIDLPGSLHRDLVAYAEALGRESGQPAADPKRLIVPMLERFIATDRGLRRRAARAASAIRYNLQGSLHPPLDDVVLWCIDLTLAKLRSRRKAGLSLLGDHTALKGSNSLASGR